jgi:hypothetical protein
MQYVPYCNFRWPLESCADHRLQIRVILSRRSYTAYSIRAAFMADPSSSLDSVLTSPSRFWTILSGHTQPYAANPGLLGFRLNA